jgi:hypothetical protein
MKTLLDQAEMAEMLRRIHGLTPAARPLWGRMNPAQMLAHGQVSLQLALGELEIERKLLGFLIGGLAKRSAVGPAPFRRNLPTAKEFRMNDARDFALEKAGLLAFLQRFQQAGPAGFTRKPHPFFGPMTGPEWETLQWKHLDHHLRQFGV